jgi:hypothetical protein
VEGGSTLGKVLAFAAAVVAAVTPVIGREILSVDSETRWTRARATAEAIKSECFRFAAQLGEYAESAAKTTFVARRDVLAAPAERAGLTPLADPIPKEGDARCPPVPLTAAWYMEHRVDEQIQYYAKGQAENEQAVMAYGLLDRRQYLAVSYGAMATRLSRIKEAFSEATVDLASLVTTTEDLLQGEHGAWSEQMTKAAKAPAKPESDDTK